MKYTKLILSLALCSTALIGDYIVFKYNSQSQIFRAISDSLVHGTIGLLSALLFFTHDIGVTTSASVCNVIICTFLSSLIDIDHAIVAKSFLFKDIANVKQRGIFHCTTFLLLISTILLIYSYMARKLNIYLLTYMLIIAFTSHHIRDGNRRGLWLYPLGHTPAISKYFYILLLAILPHCYAVMYKYMSPEYKDTVVHYDYKMVV